jgi:hypothetical protein
VTVGTSTALREEGGEAVRGLCTLVRELMVGDPDRAPAGGGLGRDPKWSHFAGYRPVNRLHPARIAPIA